MDEVDKIIVHSLNEIGCNIGDNCTMADFTPSLLVHTVSQCLRKIQPSSTANIPQALPPEGLAMAQRFAIATTMSSIISHLNYRGDIGYQTFLYPNEVDVRKLLMFLIEKLPRDELTSSETDGHMGDLTGDLEQWRRNIKEAISQQLHKPWVPQYCRSIAACHTGALGCSSQAKTFKPHHNLNIFFNRKVTAAADPTAASQSAQQKQMNNVFQQTAGEDLDLISSVLHQNSWDLYADQQRTLYHHGYQLKVSVKESTVTASTAENSNLTGGTDIAVGTLDKLTGEVNHFKSQNNDLLTKRKALISNINNVKNQQATLQQKMENLRPDMKIHERTCLVLDSPKENLAKLETLIQSTLERRKKLQQQWQEYRQPMLDNLESLRSSKKLQQKQNIKEYREKIEELQKIFEAKKREQQVLTNELKTISNDRAVATRKEYINRILEFISNIRKQRNDIFKVLDDTRDLQKQLNSISAQLQRQFCYTDDLLFQAASKHDSHAKQAYKLLATLHATCNELVELVTKTGNVTNAIRELEVQIDREKIKNVTASLQQITADIRNFENIIHNIQMEIHGIENEISNA